MRALVLVVGIVPLLAIPHVRAEDTCRSFKWSLERERAWLTGSLQDYAAIGPEGGAIKLHLRPLPGIRFDASPEREPKGDTKAGIVRLEQLSAGVYQVTLSDEAWIDVVQNGRRVPSVDFSGVKGCAGVRKSVRFRLGDGGSTVQISGALVDAIGVAVAPVPSR
jgi:hypothetical protein